MRQIRNSTTRFYKTRKAKNAVRCSLAHVAKNTTSQVKSVPQVIQRTRAGDVMVNGGEKNSFVIEDGRHFPGGKRKG